MRPALSAEQWTDRAFVERSADNPFSATDAFVTDAGNALMVGNGFTHSHSRHSEPSRLAAIIALANFALPDDDRRKLSRKWLATLRGEEPIVAAQREARLREIAAVLESYLPPETLNR